MKNHVIGVTEFKAKCLALLDGVGERGDTIIITKRGKPIATVKPARRMPRRSASQGILAGKVHIPDEILMADMSDLWECTRRG